MKYRNRRNGSVIDVNSRISGGDWDPLPDAPVKNTDGKTQRKAPASGRRKTAKTEE